MRGEDRGFLNTVGVSSTVSNFRKSPGYILSYPTLMLTSTSFSHNSSFIMNKYKLAALRSIFEVVYEIGKNEIYFKNLV